MYELSWVYLKVLCITCIRGCSTGVRNDHITTIIFHASAELNLVLIGWIAAAIGGGILFMHKLRVAAKVHWSILSHKSAALEHLVLLLGNLAMSCGRHLIKFTALRIIVELYAEFGWVTEWRTVNDDNGGQDGENSNAQFHFIKFFFNLKLIIIVKY